MRMSVERALCMLERRGRLYVFRFYRVITEQAVQAVKDYHDMGRCAFKTKSPGNGWAIYDGGLRNPKRMPKKVLQKRNMKLMVDYLTRAKEAYQRYRDNGGEEDFHINNLEWHCGDVSDWLDFTSIMDNGIKDIKEEIGE